MFFLLPAVCMRSQPHPTSHHQLHFSLSIVRPSPIFRRSLIVRLQVNARPTDANPFNLHVVLSTTGMDSVLLLATLPEFCKYGPSSGEFSGTWTNSLVRRSQSQACDDRWTPWPAIQKSAVASGNVLLYRIFPSIGNLFLVLEQLMQVRFLFVVRPFHTYMFPDAAIG